MNTHPDEIAREKMLQENQKRTSFPKYIKPWNGTPLRFAKLNEDATTPRKANESDAGFDLYASHGTIIEKHTHKLIKTGIAMQIPKGYVGLIWPRSGMAYKHGIDVFAGVIDSGYRGDIGVILYNSQYSDYNVEKGDRIAQLVLQKVEDFELVEVSDLNNTDRSEAGFGSTGI
jgi:dUTP pyrophosphatase